MNMYRRVEGLSVWARRAVLEALYANILNVVRNVCVGVRTNFTLCSTALAFITRNTGRSKEPLSKLLGR